MGVPSQVAWGSGSGLTGGGGWGSCVVMLCKFWAGWLGDMPTTRAGGHKCLCWSGGVVGGVKKISKKVLQKT